MAPKLNSNNDNQEVEVINIPVGFHLRGLGYTSISHSACADERLDAELLGAFTYAWHRLIYHGALTERDLTDRFGERVASRVMRRLEKLGYMQTVDEGLIIRDIAIGQAVML